MAIALKNIETRKTASITTTIAIAILAAALTFPTMTNVAFSQTRANDFQEFMECLFGDVGGSVATAQDIQDVLEGNSDDVTEQEIRDCFSPIYNDGTGSEDNTSSSNNNNDDDDDEADSTDGTDNTDETDTTEGDDTTEGSDETDTGGSDDTTTPDGTDSTDNTQ
ncbi:MAG: hypothetical protein M3146_02815 [Thermoproteota archaeon]|nr:hypothetical protein [Thermoproteota archaeon]